MMFDTSGFIRPFGLGPDGTLFSFGTVLSVMSVLCYYIFSMIDIIF